MSASGLPTGQGMPGYIKYVYFFNIQYNIQHSSFAFILPLNGIFKQILCNSAHVSRSHPWYFSLESSLDGAFGLVHTEFISIPQSGSPNHDPSVPLINYYYYLFYTHFKAEIHSFSTNVMGLAFHFVTLSWKGFQKLWRMAPCWYLIIFRCAKGIIPTLMSMCAPSLASHILVFLPWCLPSQVAWIPQPDGSNICNPGYNTCWACPPYSSVCEDIVFQCRFYFTTMSFVVSFNSILVLGQIIYSK